ncbi:galactose ABC transporter substrate-binding protein [Ruminococcaceae bacterium OttesenSCG-928-A16]|nr:galactose ABC transporter substrate-binding protein [Ruminococcaceae bacterium OttesenSCG-928-A16]
MKKGMAVLLCALLVATLAGCGRPLTGTEPPKTIKIGISVYDQYDTFVSLLNERFDQFKREKEQQTGVTITVLREGAGGSQVTQNNQVEAFIRDGCDIICVNLVDRTDAAMVIEKAEAANIPVVFFNRELVEEDLERWNKLYYVGAYALESGKIQGEIVADRCRQNMAEVDINGDGILQYVMLEGEAGHQDAVVRTEYSVSTLIAEGYAVERLEDEIANWSRAQAETKMAQWLATHGGAIEVVFANNDDMALGAIDALKKANVERWPLVVGIDGTPVGMQAVREGTMTGTALNDANGQAQALMELAFSLAMGQPLPAEFTLQEGKYIRFPYKTVTAETLNLYEDFYK